MYGEGAKMQVEAARRQRLLGTLAALVGFFGVAYAFTGLLEGLEPKRVATAFSAVGPIQKQLLSPPRPGGARVVLLADSTMIHKDAREEGGSQLRAVLSYGRPPKDRAEVVSIVVPATGSPRDLT
jgi:hypothetical protein